MKHDAKLALWWKLRNDPAFKPEWLRFMGQQPPAERQSDHRAWADGIGDSRVHVIEDISFSKCWVLCRCGSTFGGFTTSALEDEWDIHRGLVPQQVAQRRLGKSLSDLATDDEVEAFLVLAASPAYAAYAGDI
jgi:hypothetical protein